ncbi:MAG: glutamate 5-kinase [Limisphaerales bacterium]|jgi:glutamate 5-kinase|nr:glutamate 5-kinase [Verrucomicrobiota bacterium]
MITRKRLSQVSRIVIKLGTGVITNQSKQPDLPLMTHLARQVSDLRALGKEVIIVTSGAVGAGRGVLGFEKRPKALAQLQACAAVGQSRLMAIYEKLFSIYDLNIAQVLLTHDDLEDHSRYLNARNTLTSLLEHHIIPIINENDTVSVEELRFGDNDRLSALVSALLSADLLILLTTVDGLLQNFGTSEQKVISTVPEIDDSLHLLASGTSNDVAVGGMKTKILAAEVATRSGIPMIIANGREKDILLSLMEGKEIGTLFVPDEGRLPGRKRWIAFFNHPKGSLVVDKGAEEALIRKGKSLLFPGIQSVHGCFEEGDVVSISDTNNREFARGIVEVSSQELISNEIPEDEVIHRNNMVIL